MFRRQAPVDKFEELPAAVRMFGSDPQDGMLNAQQRELMGALIHDDGGVTLLLTPEAQKTAHMARALQESCERMGALNPTIIVTVAVLSSAYAHYANTSVASESRSTGVSSRARTFAFDMIEQAINMDASDIHLEVRQSDQDKSARVRFRVDGDMQTIHTYALPAEITLAREVAAILFQGDYADELSRSNAQSSERVLQHCLVRIPEVRNVALRYQTVLDKDGFDLILRLLTYEGKSQELLDLAVMGFEPDQIAMLITAVSRPYGASFLGGSTGSGKTTTMAGVINADPLKAKRKRYTIEDPVEIDLNDVTQINIQRAANDTSSDPFIAALKALLRADPDLAMIGEVREAATASLMSQLALSGHNIWATLHINRMFDALYRLTDSTVGVLPTVLGSNTFLNLLNAQTLTPTLCPHCRMPVRDAVRKKLVDAKVLDSLSGFDIKVDDLFAAYSDAEKNHCEHCNGKGERGRTVCAEMTLADDELKSLVAASQFDETERTYRKRRRSGFAEAGMEGKTLFDHALLKCVRGQIGVQRLVEMCGGDIERELSGRRFRGYL